MRLASLFLAAFLGLSSMAHGMAPDKQAHFAVSAAMGSTCSTIAHLITDNHWISGLGCFALVSSIGLAKELVDPYTGGKREMGDMVANLGGASLSVGVISIAFGVQPTIQPEIRSLGQNQTGVSSPAQPVLTKIGTTPYKIEKSLSSSEPLRLASRTKRFTLNSGELQERDIP